MVVLSCEKMNLPTLVALLQASNQKIDQLQDELHHWKIKYRQLYRQHCQLEQQLWCDTCRSRFEKEQDIELCPACSHRLQKQDNTIHTCTSSCPQVTTTSIVEVPSASTNTQNNAPKNMECRCTSSYRPNTVEANSSLHSLNKN